MALDGQVQRTPPLTLFREIRTQSLQRNSDRMVQTENRRYVNPQSSGNGNGAVRVVHIYKMARG